MNTTLKNRAGFTLVELMIALVLTAVLGAAMMGAFVSQSRFFDHQEKVGAARAVSRGALNIMMSEMRMIELGGGVVPTPTNSQITLRVPYVFGMVCDWNASTLTVTTLPADLTALDDPDWAGFSGFAYRQTDGSYTYIEGTLLPVPGLATVCASAGIVPGSAGVLSDGEVIQMVYATPVPTGTPIFLYHNITYGFAPSTQISGTALFRHVAGELNAEELVAPFDTTAKFRFFVSDAATAQDAVPATLSTITGLEIVLDALSERPNSDGTYQSVPLTTAVHFKNR